MMNTARSRRIRLAALCAVSAVTVAAAAACSLGAGQAAVASGSDGGPIVTIDGGAVRGAAVPGGFAFRGLPYAAPPVGDLRWRAPQPPTDWNGVRDATQFAASCPQPPGPLLPPGPLSEDCLYVNVATPAPGA